MINKIIKDLKKEIEYWNDIEKQIDNCPKENYKEFTRLEKLWMNCPIEILKAKLQAYEDAQKMICEEIKGNVLKYKKGELKDSDFTIENRATVMVVLKELLKKFKGEEE